MFALTLLYALLKLSLYSIASKSLGCALSLSFHIRLNDLDAFTYPSDSTSRWTPLLFSYTSPTTWACSGLSPARARPWRANETCAARRTQRKKEPPREAPFFYNTYFLNTGILRSTHAVAVASASTSSQKASSRKISNACPAATDCTPHCSSRVNGVIFTNLYSRFT